MSGPVILALVAFILFAAAAIAFVLRFNAIGITSAALSIWFALGSIILKAMFL